MPPLDHSRPYGKSPQTLQEPLEQPPRGGHTLTSPADPTRSRTSPRSPPRRRGTAQRPTLLGPTRPPGAGRERAGSATASGAGRGGERAGPGRGVAFVRHGQPPPGLGALQAAERNGKCLQKRSAAAVPEDFLAKAEI